MGYVAHEILVGNATISFQFANSLVFAYAYDESERLKRRYFYRRIG